MNTKGLPLDTGVATGFSQSLIITYTAQDAAFPNIMASSIRKVYVVDLCTAPEFTCRLVGQVAGCFICRLAGGHGDYTVDLLADLLQWTS